MANSNFTLQIIKKVTLRSESACPKPDFELIIIPRCLLIIAAIVLVSKNELTPAIILYILSYTLKNPYFFMFAIRWIFLS